MPWTTTSVTTVPAGRASRLGERICRARFAKPRSSIARRRRLTRPVVADRRERRPQVGVRRAALRAWREVMRVDPHHAGARNRLGYALHRNRWVLREELEANLARAAR